MVRAVMVRVRGRVMGVSVRMVLWLARTDIIDKAKDRVKRKYGVDPAYFVVTFQNRMEEWKEAAWDRTFEMSLKNRFLSCLWVKTSLCGLLQQQLDEA